jgi:ubiquinone/menaquinone biosynthesis C-methylase UbiE
VESIRLFPGADDISGELARAGFAVERVRKFVFGVAALHIARPAALPQTG